MNPDDPSNHFRYSYECQPIVNPVAGGLRSWEIKVTGTVEAYGQTLTFYRTKPFSEVQLLLLGYAEDTTAFMSIVTPLISAVRDKLAEKVMIARMKHYGKSKPQKSYLRTVRW
jgi:hypothetical protein